MIAGHDRLRTLKMTHLADGMNARIGPTGHHSSHQGGLATSEWSLMLSPAIPEWSARPADLPNPNRR